ncbi:MAG: reductive dehalogenase [Deltaproteobacteria bacterium]|nr:reductive dehalogenase [Deltaproteobacteria bacterium]
MDILIGLVLILDFSAIAACLYFAFESKKEQEVRAFRNGLAGGLIFLFMGTGLFIPIIKIGVVLIFTMGLIFGLALLIPAEPDNKALKGTKGHLAGKPVRFDERDTVFSRFRSLVPGSKLYDTYYSNLHPEKEEQDAKRRTKGFIGKPGSIDNEYQPNVAMMHASFAIPPFLGHYAFNDPDPDVPRAELSPEKASHIVKNFTRHIGADMVGICKVDPDLVYSHRGEIHYGRQEDWGKEIKDLPPYAIVFLTEMSHGHVMSAPHTPTVAESAHLYAKGAYLSTLLAKWFSYMGYKGIAENTRSYNIPLPPLAVDAGLGEIGRQGYLIAPEIGARARIFAVLTDMPLAVDKPISIGVEKFCRACKKCADSCPSKSIPQGEKIIVNGFSKWKLDEDSCYGYWSKVGTDCSICMAICPFSRPNTFLHKIVRLFVARSKVAQMVFPYVDNFLYGKRWKPKKVMAWLNYKKGLNKDEIY